MKRSQAVDKILNKLWMLGVQDLTRQDAESMLTFIEREIQMLPPYNSNGLSSYDIAMGANLHKWEPEDD